MTETARLTAITINLKVFPFYGCGNKTGNDHAVLTSLTRSDGVEKSYHRPGQTGGTMVSHQIEFVEKLAARI